MAGIFGQITEYATKYGAAFVVMTQLLGWITYLMIYLALLTAKIDVAGLLASWNMSKDLVSLAETGGLATLSFALNRLLMPVRLSVCIVVMPYIGPPLNKLLDPIVGYLGFGKKDEDKQATPPHNDEASDSATTKTGTKTGTAKADAADTSKDQTSKTAAGVTPMIWNVDDDNHTSSGQPKKRK
ncbi:hypothetical protein BASA50_001309 [Batrachochytrium salamandrivorans]|uniref:DUF1279 domain-containing protein n=1 Tax=Batrachochytrium salamandrivorans TaxID=1357716 RepID=A0ABQ8EVM8_9FUNG|nr:hypothetical protein BASA62_008245 [Batrachochytrium salamandrivorans]KAH6587303.1 hypothetical protein BASA50_001309 [Batrachochytrium salamandrivorans]KAH9276178.1 hypothetical protein BASA83_001452 [Batrachochytrium salamandrivorans]